MRNFQDFCVLVVTVGFIFSGCLNSAAQVPTASGFDVAKAPVVNPQLGKFPYFSLIEGYQPSKYGNKDAAFDRYEFFDGTKIITVEGRLQTIHAEGKGASAFEVFKTYESLVKDLGGVRVFEGKGKILRERKLKFGEVRHRYPLYDTDHIGVYMLRTPLKEVWVEAFINPNSKGRYYLTVVEKQYLKVRATLLTAAEMKQGLDSKGRIALYINFDTGKADIKPESQPMIDEIAKLLKTDPSLNLTVEGHTDNVGTPESNKRLSETRANAVAAELTKRGIEVRRLKTVGFGHNKPIDDNNTDEGRANNRRVELVKAN